MAIERSGIKIKTDSIKTKLLGMYMDSSCSGKSEGASMGKSSFMEQQKEGSSKSKFDMKNIKCYKYKQFSHCH